MYWVRERPMQNNYFKLNIIDVSRKAQATAAMLSCIFMSLQKNLHQQEWRNVLNVVFSGNFIIKKSLENFYFILIIRIEQCRI